MKFILPILVCVWTYISCQDYYNIGYTYATQAPPVPGNPYNYPSNYVNYPANVNQYASYETNRPTTNLNYPTQAPSQAMMSNEYRGNPTIFDFPNLNATADAINLRAATRGLGTAVSSMADILTKRSNSDRQKIAANYKDMYGKDIQHKFKWEWKIFGHAKEMFNDLFVPKIDYDAQTIYSSIKGIGTDLDTITGVLCGKSFEEIQQIKAAYQRKYKSTLENDLKRDTSGPVRNLYMHLLNTPRENGVNMQQVEQDAKDIVGTDIKHFQDENALFRILATRSKPHIQRVLDSYQRQANIPLIAALNKDLSGDITQQGKAVRTVKNLLECYVSPPTFFAQQFNKNMKGIGTSDKKLFRPIIARSEIDLQDIKDKYQEIFKENLKDRIGRETSGNFKLLMQGMLDGNRDMISKNYH